MAFGWKDQRSVQPDLPQLLNEPDGALLYLARVLRLGTHAGNSDEFLEFLQETRTILTSVEKWSLRGFHRCSAADYTRQMVATRHRCESNTCDTHWEARYSIRSKSVANFSGSGTIQACLSGKAIHSPRGSRRVS